MMIRRWITVLRSSRCCSSNAGVRGRVGRSVRFAARGVVELSLAMVGPFERTAAASRGRRATLVDDGSRIARDDAEALHALAVVVAGTARRTDATVRAVQEPVAGAAAETADADAELPQAVAGTAAAPARAIPRVVAAATFTGARSNEGSAVTRQANIRTSSDERNERSNAETAAAAPIRACTCRAPTHARWRKRATSIATRSSSIWRTRLRRMRRRRRGSSCGRGARRRIWSSRAGAARERHRYAVGVPEIWPRHPTLRSTRCCCRRSNRWSRFARTSSGWSAERPRCRCG